MDLDSRKACEAAEQIVTAYEAQFKDYPPLSPETIESIKKGIEANKSIIMANEALGLHSSCPGRIDDWTKRLQDISDRL